MARKNKNKKRSSADSSLSTASGKKIAEFRQEYAYVFKDLRQIFILAAVMFLILIVLNLVLQ